MKFTSESMYRAVRTFIQAFFGVLAGNMALITALDFTMEPKTVITTICIQILAPALSAGLAAVMNMKGNADEDKLEEEKTKQQEENADADDEDKECNNENEEEIFG